jgi:hypothetical protein
LDGIISCALYLLSNGFDPCYVSAGVGFLAEAPRRRGWLRHDRFAVVIRPELRSKGEYIFTGIQHSFTIAGVTSCRAKRIKEKKEKKEGCCAAASFSNLSFIHTAGPKRDKEENKRSL